MKGISYVAALPVVFGGSVALAEVPRIATDIAPVHGLVARVMQGVGEPDLVVPPGASPHGYSMRPSEARALERADAVFWMGDALTPWLEGSLETLAADAHIIELMHAEGTLELEFRAGATFGHHDHNDVHHEEGHADHADDDGHEAHDDHDADQDHDHEEHHDHEAEHAEEHDHEDHADHGDHDDHEGHSHEGTDPHAWLAPQNGQAWLTVIAEELSELDPENADTYRSNAAAGRAEIEATVQQVDAMLDSFRAQPFVVFHDAYQHFEQSFGLSAVGSISVGDASAPSPARIAEIQEAIADAGVTCVFSEPQFNPGLVATVLDGTGAQTVVIDPIGTKIPLGPTFYTDLILELGEAMASCN